MNDLLEAIAKFTGFKGSPATGGNPYQFQGSNDLSVTQPGQFNTGNIIEQGLGQDAFDVSGLNFGKNIPGAGGGNTPGFNWQSLLFGGTDGATGDVSKGALPVGLGLLKGFGDSYLGMKQLDLAKDQFDFQKDAFNANFGNAASLTNTQLADRQRARVSANPTAYQSVGDYLKENQVRTTI